MKEQSKSSQKLGKLKMKLKKKRIKPLTLCWWSSTKTLFLKADKKRGRKILMIVTIEDQRKMAFELFIKALAAAPDSLIKCLTGKEYARHTVDGAKEVEEYLFPKKLEK